LLFEKCRDAQTRQSGEAGFEHSAAAGDDQSFALARLEGRKSVAMRIPAEVRRHSEILQKLWNRSS
jgi:hypothetical protein